ncbi:MAG: hypothetical protein U5L09_01970 [Bacteroidales bacterium]|nr:hypothetical protein [Bacteroidales bacterium]
MAFAWFAEQGVDIAVIEVGMGGRLDSTNVIMPALSINYQHRAGSDFLLGHSKAKIAGEKAGIIKEETPVIIGDFRPRTESLCFPSISKKKNVLPCMLTKNWIFRARPGSLPKKFISALF